MNDPVIRSANGFFITLINLKDVDGKKDVINETVKFSMHPAIKFRDLHHAIAAHLLNDLGIMTLFSKFQVVL